MAMAYTPEAELSDKDSLVKKAMAEGLIEELKSELKDILMKVAEEEVDKVVDIASSRFKVKLENYYNPLYAKECINITWLLKKD